MTQQTWGRVPTGDETDDYFDTRSTQGHLLIVNVFDKPEYFRGENHRDGMVYPNPQRGQSFEPFPNSIIRGSVADLDQPGPDGAPGKVWECGHFYASSLLKPLTKLIGKGPVLLVLRQKDPYDKSSQYNAFDMGENPESMARANDFAARHPEFFQIAPPEPYDGKPPVPQAPAPPPQYPPQQGYPPQGPPPPPPAQWNTAAPPPGYYNQRPPQYPPAPQQGPPPGYGQQPGYPPQPPPPPQFPPGYSDDPWARPQSPAPQQGGTFLSQAPQNHHGYPQQQEPPF